MDELRGPIIIAFMILYTFTCIGVGLWAMRRTKTTADFFMAGRNLGVIVTGLAVFSSTLSGFGFVGGPGLVYQLGVSSFWMVICASASYSMSFFLLAKKLRLMAELRGSVSVPDVVAARYGSESCRLIVAIAIVVGVVGYLAAQILAMATVLDEILVVNLPWVSRNNEWWAEHGVLTCVIGSCAVLVFYCVTGGIVASVYSDVVQGLVMIVASVLVFFATIAAWNGFVDGQAAVDGAATLGRGAAGAVRRIMEDDPESVSPWGTLGIFGCLSWYLLFGLGGAGQPHIFSKMMMTKRVEDAKSILPVTFGTYVLAALLWISIGLVMRALVLAKGHDPLGNPDRAASQFLSHYANPVLAGIVFAGLFAAIMSTADGFLNIGTAAVVHDIPKALFGAPPRRELLWARVITVAITIVAAMIAMVSGDLVAILGTLGWGLFAAALVPAVAIGFNWKRATPKAVNVAVLSSLAVNLFIEFGKKPHLFEKLGLTWQPLPIPYGISGGAIALIVSTTLFFLISLASAPPRIDPEIEAVMDM